MTVPTLIVEIAFDDGPYEPNPTWTDVTQYVISASTKRGRSSDFDDTFTASASIVFNNNTRVFDPFNASGIYQGKLTPRRQVRIRGTANGTTYGIFRGFINGFPVVWNGAGKESTVTIQAFDILGLLATSKLRGDLADIYTRSLTPNHYYKCSDPSGSTTIVDYGSVGANISTSSTTFTSGNSLGIGLSGASANLSNSIYFKYATGNTPVTGDATIAFWGAWPDSRFAEQAISISSISTASSIAMYPNTPLVGQIYVEAMDDAGNIAFAYCLDNVTTSAPSHYVITYTASSGAIKIYVNGVDRTSSTAGYTPQNQTGVKLFPTRSVNLWGTQFQEVALFSRLLTSTEITNLYKFGAGNQSEDTSIRLERLLTLSDIDTDMYSVFATSFGVVLGVPYPNVEILEALMQVMVTEGGYLYVDKDGVLSAVNREFFLDNTASNTSQATIDDTGSNIPYSNEVSMWYDGDSIRNDITIEYGNGVRANASDQTSIDNYGRHTYSVRSQSSSDAEADELAQHWLDYYSPLFPSVSTIEIGTNVTSAQWATLLGLELLERITFKRTPPIGSAFQQDLCINAIELDMRPKNWVMRLNGTARFAPSAPTVTMSSTTSITGTTATLNATVSANYFNTTGIKFQYSTASNFSTFTEATATPSSTSGQNISVSANITGLSHGTTYYVRALATNTIGTTTSSSNSFTSLIVAPTASTSSATSITSSSAVLNGTVSANGASTVVKFQYNTTNNFASYTEVTASQSPVVGQSQSVSASISGLSPSTTYYFRIVATNSQGTTTTASTSFASTASLASATIASTTNFNQNRATFNGTVSANGSSTTTIKFQISTDNATWSDATGGTTISNTSSDNVSVFYNGTGLANGTLYYVRLVVINSAGTTNSSSTSFTTWALRTFSKTTSGTWNFTIPTVTPTGGSVIAPSITSVQLVGGGGGGYNTGGGGGGGAGYSATSLTFASGSSTAISVVLGAGGGAASAGGSSSISNLGVSAAGGAGSSTDIYAGRAGSSGSGNLGGTNYGANDKNFNLVAWAGGGGGGNAGAGGNGNGTNEIGGNGGGASSCTYGGGTFGGGGGGDGRNGNGASGGGNYGVGGNGEGSGSGSAGRVYFQYFADSELA